MSQTVKAIRTATLSKAEEVKQRAVKIYRYLIRGFTPMEIQKMEGGRLDQVYWYIQEGGRILGGDLKRLTEDGLLRELFLHHKERKKELWLLYSSAKYDAVKVSCLRQLAEEDDRALDLAERLGIVEQKVVKLEGEMGWVKLLTAALEAREHGRTDHGRTGAGLAAPFPN